MRDYLAPRAATGSCVTYAQVVQDLRIPSPGIKTLTQALEKMMTLDAEAGRPFCAALVVSRITSLPAQGFFDHARLLGRCVSDLAQFHAAELLALAGRARVD